MSHLVPTSEKLHNLQCIDLTSFSDSQDTRDFSDSDPFDSQDLVGLPIAQSSPQKSAKAGVCTENVLAALKEPVLSELRDPLLEPAREPPEPARESLARAGERLAPASAVILPAAKEPALNAAMETEPALKTERLRDPEARTCNGSPSPARPVGLSKTHRSPHKSPEKMAPLSAPLEKGNSLPRQFSPANSPFKKPRFCYPVAGTSPNLSFSKTNMFSKPGPYFHDLKAEPQVRSYFSQEQLRGFATVAKERPSGPRFAYPTIQLATQSNSLGSNLEDVPEIEQKRVKPMVLSLEQHSVLEMAVSGKSLFFTGSAGTGKSVLLKEIIKALKNIHPAGAVAVTASTGLAGYHIGGTTLHSFAGIGISDSDESSTLKMIRRNRKAVERWKRTDVLIVDEISMIDGRMFDKLDFIARTIRRKPHVPFGGIQIVLCGDFYQLPPVSKTGVDKDGVETKDTAVFAFESAAWEKAISVSLTLTEVFRQKGDDQFIDMLNDMRHGVVKPETEDAFLRLSRPLDTSDGIVPTELYATRFEVERANNSKLAELKGTSMLYTARDGGSLPDLAREKVLRNFLAPQKLFLKEGAQVMCIKNFDDTLVNGSVGTVIGFMDRDVYHGKRLLKEAPDLTFSEMLKRFTREKVAMLLSKNGKKVSPEEVNEKDHGYILKQLKEEIDNVFSFMKSDKSESDMSCESVYDVTVEDEDNAVEINRSRKIDFIQKLEQSSSGQKHPLVRFKCPDGITSRDVLVEPERWEMTDEVTEAILVYRVQFPLMLAWALSIHKAQGQTIPMVKVDLSRTFENGQAYVALSRASSRDGLQVINFRKHRVRCHQTVENFYSTLKTMESFKDDWE